MLIGNALNRRGISVFRNVGFNLISYRNAVHLGVIVDTDAGRFTHLTNLYAELDVNKE